MQQLWGRKKYIILEELEFDILINRVWRCPPRSSIYGSGAQRKGQGCILIQKLLICRRYLNYKGCALILGEGAQKEALIECQLYTLIKHINLLGFYQGVRGWGRRLAEEPGKIELHGFFHMWSPSFPYVPPSSSSWKLGKVAMEVLGIV